MSEKVVKSAKKGMRVLLFCWCKEVPESPFRPARYAHHPFLTCFYNSPVYRLATFPILPIDPFSTSPKWHFSNPSYQCSLTHPSGCSVLLYNPFICMYDTYQMNLESTTYYPFCYDFIRLRQSSTVVISKVWSQMSLEECKSWTCIVLLGLRAKVQVKGLSIKD